MKIALATPRHSSTVEECLERMDELAADAAERGARIVCFPEAYLPGLRGLDFDVPPFDLAGQQRSLAAISRIARNRAIAVIAGMEKITEAGRQIAALVVDGEGEVRGWQTKNQLDPTEDSNYVPGQTRQIFEIEGLRFGIAICHEAFRYPETVRWAAVRGAKVVFHQHCTGSDRAGARLQGWGTGPYYEKAMMCRSLENTIYFASVNYAFRYQESATSIIGPAGECLSYLPYGEQGVLVQKIDLERATGLLASRYAPERYQELTTEGMKANE